ncbi:hypothetical protein KFE25_012818 [Diacronema lutheri]|uniref:Uncharacterized protein n=1 Tax=Diacronema lutheri TaxID=2081491 RepID=A0A8J5X4Y0_DIALT|nr:hypothetical protein KFE25_012818 [Diacronema lutheri]
MACRGVGERAAGGVEKDGVAAPAGALDMCSFEPRPIDGVISLFAHEELDAEPLNFFSAAGTSGRSWLEKAMSRRLASNGRADGVVQLFLLSELDPANFDWLSPADGWEREA